MPIEYTGARNVRNLIIHDVPWMNDNSSELITYLISDRFDIEDDPAEQYRIKRLTFSEGLMTLDSFVGEIFDSKIEKSFMPIFGRPTFRETRYELSELTDTLKEYESLSRVRKVQAYIGAVSARNRIKHISKNPHYQTCFNLITNPPKVETEVVPDAKKIVEEAYREHTANKDKRWSRVDWDHVGYAVQNAYDKFLPDESMHPDMFRVRLTPVSNKIRNKVGFTMNNVISS